MIKKTTRLRILDFIRGRQTASVGELSRFLRMTGSNIRHHLAVLEVNGLIEVVGRHKDGRGRPSQVYGLSRRVLGDNLDELAVALLRDGLAGKDVDGTEAVFKGLARALTANSSRPANAPLSLRLRNCIDWLNDHHYQARWEASARGPKIILGYCPYAAILARCGDICTLDRKILETLVDEDIRQLGIRETSLRGERVCSFLVRA